jgi:hypothetical protein
MTKEIVNKVANSGLINIDLEDWYPQGKRSFIDIKDWLFEGLILKEKDFRKAIIEYDWSVYKNHLVAIDCSNDAIVPVWAYMLLTNALSPYAKKVIKGNLEQLEVQLYQELIENMDTKEFENQRLIIKGCSNLPIPESAYVAITKKLRPLAKSIMYGEACSSVPIFKKK